MQTADTLTDVAFSLSTRTQLLKSELANYTFSQNSQVKFPVVTLACGDSQNQAHKYLLSLVFHVHVLSVFQNKEWLVVKMVLDNKITNQKFNDDFKDLMEVASDLTEAGKNDVPVFQNVQGSSRTLLPKP